MLNQSGITRVSGGVQKVIVVNTATYDALPCLVANTGVSAVDGKKIVKAGTPLYGSLTARGTAFTISGAENAQPVGVLESDVDVTAGNANASVIITGLIDVSKLDSAVATALASATPAHIILVQ